MKKQLKTPEEMAVEFRNLTEGKGYNSRELASILAQVMREGGHNPDDEGLRVNVRTAYRSAA